MTTQACRKSKRSQPYSHYERFEVVLSGLHRNLVKLYVWPDWAQI